MSQARHKLVTATDYCVSCRDRSQIVGKHISAFSAAGHEHRVDELTAALDSTGAWRGTMPMLHADGRQIELEWSVSIHSGPGIRLAITADGAHHVNTTYYSDVRVPVSMRVGDENAGWQLITTKLNHERVMLGPAGRLAGLYERVRTWASAAEVLDEPDVRRALAEVRAVTRINELLNWQVASAGK